MALVIGTNAGFVTTAPTADPAGANNTQDAQAFVTKDTSPSTAVTITEVGWYCDNATEAANFEIGLYAADGAVVPGEAGTLLFNTGDQAKGTTAGWKVVTVNWSISSSTAYWLGVQLDNTATTTSNNIAASGGFGADFLAAATDLPNPFGGGVLGDADAIMGIYAVWAAAAGGSTFKQGAVFF